MESKDSSVKRRVEMSIEIDSRRVFGPGENMYNSIGGDLDAERVTWNVARLDRLQLPNRMFLLHRGPREIVVEDRVIDPIGELEQRVSVR